MTTANPEKLLNKPLRIVFVLPSLLRAGAESQVVNLINNLDPALFEMHLVVFERQLDQLDRVNRKIVHFHHYLRRHRYDISPAIQLARLIDRHQIDIVHCSLQISLFVGWLAIRISRHNPKLILALHTTLNRDKRTDLFDKFFYQFLMRSCTKVICVCKAQETHWQTKFPFLCKKTEVIYNGVDTEWFTPYKTDQSGSQLRKKLGIPDHAFVACCIAAFRPEKGHKILLRTFRDVIKKHPEIFLILAGDGVLRQEIETYSRAIGLSKKIIFLGLMTDVRPVLSASDISIIASTAVETFSIAMLESMAMRVPMVATNIGGTAEAVRCNQTGLLVSPGNGDELAAAMTYMIEHNIKRKRMSYKCRKVILAEFTNEMMVKNTTHHLRQK